MRVTAVLLSILIMFLATQTVRGASGDLPNGDAETAAAMPEVVSETADRVSPLDAILDSLGAVDDSASHWGLMAGPTGWLPPDSLAPTYRDSGRWIPSPTGPASARTPSWRRLHFEPAPRLGYSKVEGMRPGGGLEWSWLRGPSLRLEGSLDRALAWGRWEPEIVLGITPGRGTKAGYSCLSRDRITGGGAVRAREDLAADERGAPAWVLHAGYSRRSVPFGGTRLEVAAIPASAFSLDYQDYLEREEVFFGARWTPVSGLGIEATYANRLDRAQQTHATRLWNTDPSAWRNQTAEGVRVRGALLGLAWMPGRGSSAAANGVWLRGSAWGAALGGDREFYTMGFEARRRWIVPGAESLDLDFRWAKATRMAPLQELPDLGGIDGLRAYPPWSLLGGQMILVRADYALASDPLRALRIPLLRKLHLQPVLFGDLGTAWERRAALGSISDPEGEQSIPAEKDLRLESKLWRSNWGVGVQRNLGLPGGWQRFRVDFGFRTDRGSDRLRVTVRFTR